MTCTDANTEETCDLFERGRGFQVKEGRKEILLVVGAPEQKRNQSTAVFSGLECFPATDRT